MASRDSPRPAADRRLGYAGFGLVLAVVLLALAPGASTEAVRPPAAVGIVGRACGRPVNGSGVLITAADGELVVTAAHVVAGATRLEVVVQDRTVHRALAVGFDEGRDIALLRSEPLETSAARVGSASSGSGQLAVVDEAGALELIPYEIMSRVRAHVIDETTDLEASRRALELRAAVEPGASGAGLFASRDEIVGLVWAASRRDPQRAWAVDGSEILAALGGLPADPTRAVDLGRCG